MPRGQEDDSGSSNPTVFLASTHDGLEGNQGRHFVNFYLSSVIVSRILEVHGLCFLVV